MEAHISSTTQITKNEPNETLQSTLCDIVYNQEGPPKMKRMLSFWEMRDSSMRFTPILPKTSHHTIHNVYV